MRIVLLLLFMSMMQSARADICCPNGCVPKYTGSTACVKNGTGQACGSGYTCGGSGGGGGGGGGSGSGGVVLPNPSPSCGNSLICNYANGVVTVAVNYYGGPGVIYHAPQPPESVYTEVVYAKGCVGGGSNITIPFGAKGTVNLYTLPYHNLCTNELPMSFRAQIGAIPDGKGECGCSILLPPPPYGPASCRQGYVWRGAFTGDNVCVTPDRRKAVEQESANSAFTATLASTSLNGPRLCKPGFVWRAARPADVICVTPQSREQVKAENASAWDHVAHIAGQ